MWFTDPQSKKRVSFRNMVVMFSEGKAFLTLLGKGGEPLATVPCSSANAKACFRACEKRGLVANIDSKKGEAFLKGESK